jgi:hypothetical protein
MANGDYSRFRIYYVLITELSCLYRQNADYIPCMYQFLTFVFLLLKLVYYISLF